MLIKMFLNLEEALELLNSLDLYESDVEITMLPPDVSEITEEEEDDVN